VPPVAAAVTNAICGHRHPRARSADQESEVVAWSEQHGLVARTSLLHYCLTAEPAESAERGDSTGRPAGRPACRRRDRSSDERRPSSRASFVRRSGTTPRALRDARRIRPSACSASFAVALERGY
jgi:hypothetical protein